MRRSAVSVKFWLILLLAACLWTLLGAPVFPHEWQALPSQAGMAFRQLPVRLPVMWRSWLMLAG